MNQPAKIPAQSMNPAKEGRDVAPVHGPETGFESVDRDVETLPAITIENLAHPEIDSFRPGDVISVLQVNGKDNRDASKGEVGALMPEAATKEEEITSNFLGSLIEGFTDEEIDKLDILVIASSAKLVTLDGVKSEHKRAVDTAQHAIVGFTKALEARGKNGDAIVNNRGLHGGEVFETESLLDVPFLHDTNPSVQEYVREMVEKYGTGHELWAVYEKDMGEGRKLRERHGVTGPQESADRVAEYMKLTVGFIETYRAANPDRRLIIWNVGHYDSLTHHLKEQRGHDIRTTIMPMDKLSGVVFYHHKPENELA